MNPRRFAIPGVAAASCAIAVVVFGVGSRDDPYITYWEAEQLAKTGRLVNINGAHIEQSSSLAHVVVLAALYFVTRAPLPALGYVVGIAGLFATVLLSARLAGRLRPGSQLATAIVVGLAFPCVYWAIGGLETDVAAASVLWFVLCLHALLTAPGLAPRTVLAFAASTVLVVTVRPDTMIVSFVVSTFVLCLWATRIAAKGRLADLLPTVEARRTWLTVGGVGVAIVVLAAFRELVFHALLPQPEIAKTGGLAWFSRGFSYVATSFPWWMWLVFLILIALGTWWCVVERSLLGYSTIATFLAGIAVLCFSRGDWMGGARLLVPYLAPGLVVMVVGAWSLRTWGRGLAIAALLGVECVTIVLFADGASWLSSQYETLVPSSATASAADYGSFLGGTLTTSVAPVPSLPWYSSWGAISTRDAVFLSAATPVLRALIDREPAGQPITIASNQAGMVIYTWANEFPGKLRFIDTESIVTNDFSTCGGLFASYAGNLMTIAQWATDADVCAPRLPDLYFSLNFPSGTDGLARYYHVISSVSTKYERRGIGTTSTIYGYEYLAQRDGWVS